MNGCEDYNPCRYLSMSGYCNFRRCPRRYFYCQGLRLESPEPKPALVFGKAMHLAMPIASRGDINGAMEGFKTVWTPEIEETIKDDKRNVRRAKAMVLDFASGHSGDNALYRLVDPPKNPYPRDPDTSAMEVAFAIDVGASVPYVGIVDGLGEHRDTVELWGIEYKTTSSLSSWFMNAFEMNVQIIGGTVGLRTVVGDHVRGMIVDATLVSKTKEDSLTHPVYVSQHLAGKMVRDIQVAVMNIQDCETLRDFPMRLSGCHPYGMFGVQGFTCEYVNLCSVEDWTSLRDTYKTSERSSEFARFIDAMGDKGGATDGHR